jgi:hypothetical protein
MGRRAFALVLTGLAVAGGVALVVGLLALFGVDIASTNDAFVVPASPHLRSAVLLPLVYVVIPGLATAAAAVVFLASRRRRARPASA